MDEVGPAVVESVDIWKDEVGTSIGQYLVRERSRIDSNGKAAGCNSSLNSQRSILDDDSLERLYACFLHAHEVGVGGWLALLYVVAGDDEVALDESFEGCFQMVEEGVLSAACDNAYFQATGLDLLHERDDAMHLVWCGVLVEEG